MEAKIKKIETLRKVFTYLTIAVGIITVIDYLIPDPVIFIDEALLASLTGLLTIITSTLEDKERELKNGNKAKLKQEEALKITGAAGELAKNIKRIKKK